GAPGEKPTRHPPTNVAGEIERRGVIVQLVIDLGERERRMSVVDTPLGEGDPGGLEPSTGGGEITLPAHEAARQQPRSPGPYARGLSVWQPLRPLERRGGLAGTHGGRGTEVERVVPQHRVPPIRLGEEAVGLVVVVGRERGRERLGRGCRCQAGGARL